MRAIILSFIITCLCCNIIVMASNNNHYKHNQLKIKGKLSSEPKRIETINQLVKVIMNRIPGLIKKYSLNPFPAPDQREFIFPVNLRLSNIEVYNLSSIRTASDLILMDYAASRKMTAHLKLAFDDIILKSKYNAYVKAPILPAVGSKGGLTAVVPTISVDLKATLDFKDVNVTLDSLQLSTDRRRMTVRLSKNLESYVANAAMPAILMILQRVILKIIEDPFRKQINAILYGIIDMINAYLLDMSNS